MTTPSATYPPETLLNEAQAAARLNLAVSTLRRWRWAGRGPQFARLGTAIRYRPEDLTEYVAAGLRRSTSDPGTADVN